MVLVAAGCSNGQRIEVQLRVPAGNEPLALADSVSASVRDGSGATLAFGRFPVADAAISLPPVPPGSGYSVELDATFDGDVVSRGRSCAFDVGASGSISLSLWFSRAGGFALTGAPAIERSGAAVFALAGDVIVAGGTSGGSALSSSERYRAAAGSFTPAPMLVTPRADAIAVATAADNVLILGGAAPDGVGVDVFSPAHSLPEAIAFPSDLGDGAGVRLGDGSALVAGGRRADGSISGDAFIVSGDGSSLDGVGGLVSPRADYTLTLAGPDRFAAAFAVGGRDAAGPIAAIEIYDPATSTFAVAGAQLATPRYGHTTTLLPTGELLIAGGFDVSGAPLASAEVFDPVTRAVRPVAALAIARARHAAVLLASGRVLVSGGSGAGGVALSDNELFDPALGGEGGFVATAPLVHARAGHAIAPLCDGTFLVVGGGAGAEIYNPL